MTTGDLVTPQATSIGERLGFKPIDSTEIWGRLKTAEDLPSVLGLLLEASPPFYVRLGLSLIHPSRVESDSLQLVGHERTTDWPGLMIAPKEGAQIRAWILKPSQTSRYSIFHDTEEVPRPTGVYKIDYSMRFGVIVHLDRMGEIYHYGRSEPEIGSLARVCIPDQATLESVIFFQQPQ